MKTAKVQEIVKTNKWDKSQYWTMYFIYMKMDNGDTINLLKKKEDAFKVWDTISYEENGEWKWKEVKAENNFKKSFNPEATNKSATIWMALKIAFEVLYDKKEQNFNECIALAQRIYEEAMAMYNGTKEEEKSDEAELPF